MSDQTMTIGITGPRRRAPWRGAVMVLIIAAIVLSICLILLGLTGDFLVDWLWFSTIGYLGVFWTTIAAEAEVFFVIFVATAIILWVNGSIASRFGRLPWTYRPADFEWKRTGIATLPDVLDFMRHRLPWPFVTAAGASLLAMLVAWGEVHNWGVFLRFLYQVPYGASDPLYDKDIGFYLFALPAYVVIKNWMLLTLLLSALFAGAIYWVRGHIEYDPQRRSMSPTAIAHGSVLLGFFFVVKAWCYGLDRYLLLYHDNGVVVGASYTDIHVELHVLWLLTGLSIVAAFAAWANLRVRTYRLPAAAAVLVFGGSVVLSGLIPGLFQRLFVKPNELQLEKPYIERNIALTQHAYNLRQITAKPFPAEQDLTFKTLEANKATIDNIRLWDWQPLMDAYVQLQEIRTYYKFHDVDVDRYWLDAAYQSVMLSARELKSSLLPPNAQTWVNRHVLFTHGNGVVMSPVTRKSAEGLPLFYLRDIPPVADGGPKIREPRIYYGEESDSYVIVKGSTPEFDYPRGKDNVHAAYDGSGGVPVGRMVWRILFAHYFNDVNLLLSSYNPSDPIAATYQRIFPSLFKPFTAMPPDLQKHIRYPEDLFLIQARLYQAYHMEAADVFYNREDLWQFPRQPGGDGTSMMTPYYIIMRLPGEPQAEFFLMLPMVPSHRDNMIAWLAARCDAPNYGKLIVYEFPKDKLVYGPFQIEARINQSTEISQQITLWNQMGSRVIRGANLLVIPIENSILYVSPLYLRAEHGHLPELKRVIAAYGEHVVMKETLTDALAALFIEPGGVQGASNTAEEMPRTGPAASQAREALDRYNQAVERLKSGDWKGFGTQFDAMRELLEEMNRRSTGH